MTIGSYNAFNLILLIQFLAIVIGTLLTSAILKVNGYPDIEIMMWNPVSVFIRNWGWIAIFIPGIVYCALYRYASFKAESLEERSYIILALLTTILIILFYSYTIITAAQRKYLLLDFLS